MFLARDKHHLADLCHLIRHEAPYLFQEYVKESHGRDVRVVLVGGRVIGSMLRCSTDGRMQSNCSLGMIRGGGYDTKLIAVEQTGSVYGSLELLSPVLP